MGAEEERVVEVVEVEAHTVVVAVAGAAVEEQPSLSSFDVDEGRRVGEDQYAQELQKRLQHVDLPRGTEDHEDQRGVPQLPMLASLLQPQKQQSVARPPEEQRLPLHRSTEAAS